MMTSSKTFVFDTSALSLVLGREVEAGSTFSALQHVSKLKTYTSFDTMLMLKSTAVGDRTCKQSRRGERKGVQNHPEQHTLIFVIHCKRLFKSLPRFASLCLRGHILTTIGTGINTFCI